MIGGRSSDQAELPDQSRWTDRGDTLIEVLLALVILGIAGVALLTGFATSITASGTHKNLATLDTSVRAASNQVIAQVQQSKNNVFGPNTCTGAAANPTTNTSFSPTWNLSGSFTVTSYNVQYWNGTAFVGGPGSCTNPYGPQLWVMNIASHGYSSQVSTVIYDAGAPAVTGGTTPSKLVFMQPTTTGSGTVNAAVSPQPILAVEDSSSNIVYSDASSVTLTASGGTGTLSNNCTGVENNGVVSFSGCSFSAPGTYTVKASDGSLATATASYSITTAPVAKVVFTTSPVTQVASTNTGTSVITVQEQDAFGTPVPGALTVNLSSTSSTGVFSLSSGSTSAVTSVSIPAGKSSASFYYGDKTAGSPTLAAAASGLQTGSQTETINGATPVKVTLAATPASAGVSNTTDVALGLQLVDQYGNSTTAGSSGVSLALSTSSSKGYFSANNNASGSATATVAFASGAGTATEYYGDKTVGAPTVTAKNGSSTWGTVPLTMTVGAPSTITLNSGSGQSTLVNTGFTNALATTVTDAFGNPVPGASVTFSAPANGASVTFGTCAGGNPQTYQCVATTNASGQATSSAFAANTTSGGPYSIAASAGSTNTVNFATTNTPGSATQVVITPSPTTPSASSTTNTALGFQLADQYGNNATAGTGGISLSLSTSSSKGVFSASNNATGSATATISFASGAGTATEYYGDQTAGSPTITAKKVTATWGTASPTITAKTTGDNMTIVAGSGQSATVGTAFGTALQVQDVDQFGNPVSGALVTFSAPASGASGTFATCSGGNPQTYQCVVATNASGQASAPTFTANTLSGGAYSVTTAVSGDTTPPTFSETNTAGSAFQVAITPTPTSASASTTTNVKLGFQLQDAFGNNTTAGSGGVTLSVSSTSTKDFFSSTNGGTGTLNTPVNVTFANGVGTATEYYGDQAAGTWTVNALNGSSNWGSTPVTITGGTPAQVAITPTPTSASASTTTNVKLGFQLQDAFGNNTTAGSGGVTLSVSSTSTKDFFSSTNGGTGTLNTPVNVTFANGVGTATEYYGDQAAGTWTVNALNGSSNWGSTPVTITAKTTGDNMTIVAGSGQSATVGTAFGTALQVQDVDQFGNPVSGALVTFSAPASGASGTFATCSGGNPQTYQCVVATNASGQASAPTFTANTLSGGAYSVTTAVSGDTTPPTFSETNTAGSAFQVAITPTPTSASASTTTNVKLGFQLQDAFGNNTTAGSGGVTLSVSSTSTKEFFSSTNGGTGTLNTPVNVTFANGVGTATEYYGDQAAGTWTVNALNGSSNWGSTPVTITAKTTGDNMTIVAGSGQSATVGTAFGTALQVQDVDQFGNPVSGALVTFSAPASGASGTFATCSGGNPQTYQCVVATNASGQASAPTFTANTLSGGAYSVTTAVSGDTTPPTFSETNTAGSAAQVFITPTPSTSSASTTTNVALGFQLVDQYGNNATAGSGGVTLSVSSTSTKEFFSSTNGGTGTLNTPVNVTFANGVGTATEYYGGQAAGTWTVTALKSSSNWGSTPVTITAKTTGDAMTIVAGNSQSTPISTAFGTALQVQDVDQFGNPVSGIGVTFSAPATGVSGTFASGGNCTSNPHTYQCVVTTNASGQATASTFTANATAGNYSVTTAASGVGVAPQLLREQHSRHRGQCRQRHGYQFAHDGQLHYDVGDDLCRDGLRQQQRRHQYADPHGLRIVGALDDADHDQYLRREQQPGLSRQHQLLRMGLVVQRHRVVLCNGEHLLHRLAHRRRRRRDRIGRQQYERPDRPVQHGVRVQQQQLQQHHQDRHGESLQRASSRGHHAANPRE